MKEQDATQFPNWLKLGFGDRCKPWNSETYGDWKFPELGCLSQEEYEEKVEKLLKRHPSTKKKRVMTENPWFDLYGGPELLPKFIVDLMKIVRVRSVRERDLKKIQARTIDIDDTHVQAIANQAEENGMHEPVMLELMENDSKIKDVEDNLYDLFLIYGHHRHESGYVLAKRGKNILGLDPGQISAILMPYPKSAWSVIQYKENTQHRASKGQTSLCDLSNLETAIRDGIVAHPVIRQPFCNLGIIEQKEAIENFAINSLKETSTKAKSLANNYESSKYAMGSLTDNKSGESFYTTVSFSSVTRCLKDSGILADFFEGLSTGQSPENSDVRVLQASDINSEGAKFSTLMKYADFSPNDYETKFSCLVAKYNTSSSEKKPNDFFEGSKSVQKKIDLFVEQCETMNRKNPKGNTVHLLVCPEFRRDKGPLSKQSFSEGDYCAVYKIYVFNEHDGSAKLIFSREEEQQ